MGTLLDKLTLFNIPYCDDQKFFKSMAILDFESNCVQEDKICDADTTTWIGRHIPISVSISSNLIEQPIVLCQTRRLVESFVDALGGLATQSEAQKKLKRLDIETSVKSKLNQNFSTLNQRHCRNKPVLEIEDECIEEEEEEEQNMSIQFLQTEKCQHDDLQKHLKRYCNVLAVIGFSGRKNDKIITNNYLLLLLVNEQCIEPSRRLISLYLSSLEMFSC